MPRVFACLAVSELVVLLGAAVLGFMGGFGQTDRHIVLAVFALLLSCLIQVVVFTYLTVTGKMMAQAVHLAGLGLDPLQAAKHYKRTATRWMALLIAAIVVTTVTGAQSWRTDVRSTWHLAAAFVLIAVHTLVFYRQYSLVLGNARLFDRTLQAYTRRRAAARSSAKPPTTDDPPQDRWNF